MKMSEGGIKDLATALSKAQALFKGAKRGSENPFYKSLYADLGSVFEAIREAFGTNGLSVVQEPSTTAGVTYLSATILHASGQWLQFDPLIVPIEKPNSPQALKSGLTYIRRAQLLAIVGLPEVDDDAEAAEGPRDHLAQAPVQAKPSGKLSDAQVNRMFAIAKSNGYSNEDVMKMIFPSAAQDLTKVQYDDACAKLSVKRVTK